MSIALWSRKWGGQMVAPAMLQSCAANLFMLTPGYGDSEFPEMNRATVKVRVWVGRRSYLAFRGW